MKLTKQRLEAFSDGVIAIIITIMVLSIPIPEKFDFNSIIGLLLAIFVYFLSFIVVGAFWSQHHRVFTYTDQVNNKVISFNLLFLFFLSLIPILTKWVIYNPGILAPVIGYDIVYLLTNLSYMFIFRSIVKSSDHDDIIELREMHQQMKDADNEAKYKGGPNDFSWIRFIVTVSVIIAMIILSILIPQISTIFLLGLPVLSSIINLLFEDFKRNRRFKKHNQK